jgi:tetratricopeptide (TPR) repeat protein
VALSSRAPLSAALLALLVSTAAIAPAFAAKSAEAPGFRPTTASGSLLAGRLAANLRDDDNAAAFYAQALRSGLFKDDQAQQELTNRTFVALLTSGEMDKAVTFANKVIAIDKKNPIAHLVLGIRAFKARNYNAARTELAFTLDKPILQLATPLISTWTYAGAGQTKKGVAASDDISSNDGFSTFKNFSAGMMLDLAGQHEEAIARLKDAHERDANAVSVTDAYARALVRGGKKDEALAVLNDYAAKVPRQPVVAGLIADIQAGKRIQPAATTAQQGAADILISVAAGIAKQGGADYAVVFYRLALYLDGTNPNALIGLAELYSDLKQQEVAQQLFQAVPPSSPLKRNAEIELATTLDELDKTDEGVAHLKKIIAANPKDLDAIISLGGIYQTRKRWDEAVGAFSQAIDVIGTPSRNDWSTFYYRGIAYERTKNWPKAEADFKKALELYPDQPSVLNYLGYSWIDQGMHLQEGMDMIKKAVDQRPDDGYIVDSLGWANYKLGQYDEAVEQLERAVSLKPSDPTINDHLGDAYWKAGRKLEATFQWRHALDSKPEADEKAELESKMKQGMKDTASADATKPAAIPTPAADAPKPTEPPKPAVEAPAPVNAPQPAGAPKPADPLKPTDAPKPGVAPKPAVPGSGG